LTFLDVVDRGVGDSMRRVSPYLFDRLRALAAKHPGLIVDVRGAGLIAGLEFSVDALPIANAALDRGLIVNRTSSTVVRLLPPYIVAERDVDEAIEILTDAIGAAS
jgi:acetylornithine/succinyldiaminopimelate/putrescine aminotransferase